MFGVVFPNHSFPIEISIFAQIDTFHWILYMNTFVGEAYDQVREICIFLLNSFILLPDKALAVYIKSPGSPFVFVGAVTIACPSAVLSLPWPDPGYSEGTAQLQLTADAQPLTGQNRGVGGGPGVAAVTRRGGGEADRAVDENLFNFMQFLCGVDGSKLVVPMDILDRWFKKFHKRAKLDPEYLKGFAL